MTKDQFQRAEQLRRQIGAAIPDLIASGSDHTIKMMDMTMRLEERFVGPRTPDVAVITFNKTADPDLDALLAEAEALLAAAQPRA